jgi:hypothetical protein
MPTRWGWCTLQNSEKDHEGIRHPGHMAQRQHVERQGQPAGWLQMKDGIDRQQELLATGA